MDELYLVKTKGVSGGSEIFGLIGPLRPEDEIPHVDPETEATMSVALALLSKTWKIGDVVGLEEAL